MTAPTRPHPSPSGFDAITLPVGEPAPVHRRRRTVLVTGAARRLGKAIALHLAEQGWNVALHHRNSATEAHETAAECSILANGNGHFESFFAELADEHSVRSLWTQVLERYGQLDAIVNSASTFEHDSATTLNYAMLERHLRANTGAPVVLAQCLHAHLQARAHLLDADAAQSAEHLPQGVVVNLLDQKLWNPNPDFFSYTLSKAALEAANTLLAQALAPLLRVVGVAPGLTLTSHMLTTEQFDALHQLSPLGRSSTVEDVVATVAFALNNRSITGTTLLVDGGQHLMKFERDFSLMP